MHPPIQRLLGSGLLACALSTPALADTIFVDGSGGGDYLTIQEGVDAAMSGDLIIVAAGTYIEEVTVDVSVSIVGSGPGLTTIMPATSNPGSGTGGQLPTTTWLFRIQANNVTLSSLSLNGDNPALAAAIDARGAIVTESAGTVDNLEVFNSEIINFSYRGIFAAAGGTGHNFSSNTLRNINEEPLDSAGILLAGGTGDATDNVFDNCAIGFGFMAGGGGTVDDNDFDQCGLGVLASQTTSALVVQNSTFDTCDQGIQVAATAATADLLGNTFDGCATAMALFGNGVGTITADNNQIEGLAAPGSTGVYHSTDAGALGQGDLTVVLTNNTFQNIESAIELVEDSGNNAPLLTCTISGASNSFNTFSGNLSFNVRMQDCNDAVNAQFNCWGAVSNALIEAGLFHQVDDPALGLIDFTNSIDLVVIVDDDGPADFTTINPAVQAVTPGGTIYVSPGLYVENLLVDRSCIIQGTGTDPDLAVGTTLHGSTVDPDLVVVTVTGPDVTIRDLRIDGEQSVFDYAGTALLGLGASNLTVENCAIYTAVTGIEYNSSTAGVFIGNEIFDYGEPGFSGGGIVIDGSSATVGQSGQPNYLHDEVGGDGIIFHNGSSGLCEGNRVEGTRIAYLCSEAGAATTFRNNQASDCEQGFQAIGNNAPVTFDGNVSLDALTGFVFFSLGGQVHTFTNNYVRHGLGSPNSSGFLFTNFSPFGNDDLHCIAQGNIIHGTDYGVVLHEDFSSVGLAMDANFDGSGSPNFFTGSNVQDFRMIGVNDSIDATDNFFGSTDVPTVEAKITHFVDDFNLGLVDFSNLQPPGHMRLRGELVNDKFVIAAFTGDIGLPAIVFYGPIPACITLGAFGGKLLIDPLVMFFAPVTTIPASGMGILEQPVTSAPVGVTLFAQGLMGPPGSKYFTDLDQMTPP